VVVPSNPIELVTAAAAGDRRALARLITLVEEDREGAAEALKRAFDAARPAHRIGITGAPGAGKSTLTDQLITIVRTRDESIGVLAVDPTSPFSGGAVLGDRVRMQDHVLDEDVYIRSMASRGHLGGLSEAAPKALVAMEAAGFDRIIIETVGVGQDEVEVTSAADTVIVILTPGWGDGIQAAKAGILEIGDIFVVNKADRPGVRDTIADLRSMLALGGDLGWEPPIVETIASRGSGVADVWEAIERHQAHLGEAGIEKARRARRRAELGTALAALIRQRAGKALETGLGAELAASVERGDTDPWTAADQLAAV
jgi:LAO/AO transport system kinase